MPCLNKLNNIAYIENYLQPCDSVIEQEDKEEKIEG